jgi:transposase
MFSLTSTMNYFYYRGRTDMRRSFNALCGTIHDEMKRDPLSGEVFIFVSKQRDKVKLLHWEHGGFVLYYKRLEEGVFEMPVYDPETTDYRMKWSDLVMMVEGIKLYRIKHRKRYKTRDIVEKNVENIST